MLLTRLRSSLSAPRAAVGRAVFLGFFAWLALAASARAEVTTLDGVDAPIVRVNVRQGDVTIRTWDRSTVAIDGDPALSVQRRTVREPSEQSPILIPQAQANSEDGVVQLPPESFVVASIPEGAREEIVVKSPAVAPGQPMVARGPVTVTVPSDTVFVFAHTANGNLDVHDLRSGTLVGFVGRGRLSLDGVGGTVFAQTGRGPLTIADSSFDRLRARSLFGNITLERCRVRQIQATSINGSIVYDGGRFEPGLARFESTRGDIAIGTANPAEIGAHAAGDGRVFTAFERGARVEGREGEARAVVAGGGPLVTATTQGGNVYLYDGDLRSRAQTLPQTWQAPLGTLQRPGLRREDGARPVAQPRQLYPQPFFRAAPRATEPPFRAPLKTPFDMPPRRMEPHGTARQTARPQATARRRFEPPPPRERKH